jgi:hypothetical protein
MLLAHKRLSFLLMILLTLSACSEPRTKEAYMSDFREFVSSVEQAPNKEAPDYWQKTNLEYEKYTSEWYTKFSDQLTWRDELAIAQLQVRYNLVESAIVARDLTQGARIQYTQLRAELQTYMENDMQSDIDQLIETARASGAMVESEINALLEEIRKDVER